MLFAARGILPAQTPGTFYLIYCFQCACRERLPYPTEKSAYRTGGKISLPWTEKSPYRKEKKLLTVDGKNCLPYQRKKCLTFAIDCPSVLSMSCFVAFANNLLLFLDQLKKIFIRYILCYIILKDNLLLSIKYIDASTTAVTQEL